MFCKYKDQVMPVLHCILNLTDKLHSKGYTSLHKTHREK